MEREWAWAMSGRHSRATRRVAVCGWRDTRVKLGREGTRRDARARARAQLNNGLPYPPSLLTRALRLFVSLRRSRCRRHRRRYYSSLIFSPYRSFILFSPRSFVSWVYLYQCFYLRIFYSDFWFFVSWKFGPRMPKKMPKEISTSSRRTNSQEVRHKWNGAARNHCIPCCSPMLKDRIYIVCCLETSWHVWKMFAKMKRASFHEKRKSVFSVIVQFRRLVHLCKWWPILSILFFLGSPIVSLLFLSRSFSWTPSTLVFTSHFTEHAATGRRLLSRFYGY